MCFLVVEDELLIRMSLADDIQKSGFEVLEASTADEAIKILEQRDDIRVVMTDVQMENSSMDGIALAHYVRERWPPTILIVCSGRRFPSERELPAGTTFLPKPYELSRLSSLLKSVSARLSAE